MLRNLIRSYYKEAHMVPFLLCEIQFGVHDNGGHDDGEGGGGDVDDPVSLAV